MSLQAAQHQIYGCVTVCTMVVDSCIKIIPHQLLTMRFLFQCCAARHCPDGLCKWQFDSILAVRLPAM